MGTTLARRADGRAQMRRAKPGSWTEAKRNRFLHALSATVNARQAAREAKVSEQGAYALRRRDAGFGRAWEEALNEGCLRLEIAMLARALAGYDPDSAHDSAKAPVPTVPALSERAALALLARRRNAGATAVPVADAEAADAEVTERLLAKLTEMSDRLLAIDVA